MTDEALQDLGAHAVQMEGGFSGETFLVGAAGEQAVLRLYGRHPERAAVDVLRDTRSHRLLSGDSHPRFTGMRDRIIDNVQEVPDRDDREPGPSPRGNRAAR